MTERIDLTGNRYGKLVVIKYVGNLRWRCKCDCGNTTNQKGQKLRENLRKSCGCEQPTPIFIEHDGKTFLLRELAEQSGLSISLLRNRVRLNLKGKELVRESWNGKRLKRE